MEPPGPAFGGPDDKLRVIPGSALSRITLRSIRATSTRWSVFRRHKKPTNCAVRCRIVGLETQNFVYMTIVENQASCRLGRWRAREKALVQGSGGHVR